jgi:hypothetical protein
MIEQEDASRARAALSEVVEQIDASEVEATRSERAVILGAIAALDSLAE